MLVREITLRIQGDTADRKKSCDQVDRDIAALATSARPPMRKCVGKGTRAQRKSKRTRKAA